jgi:long-chain acyl-CoA synthetase
MEKWWQEHYPTGVAKEIDLASTITLNDLFTEVCKKYPDKRALTSHKETITFAQTEKYVNNLATSLLNLGVKKGDRVAIIMPNLIQYPLSIFACFKIGAIVVNINPLYTASEIDYLLENSGAKTVHTRKLLLLLKQKNMLII